MHLQHAIVTASANKLAIIKANFGRGALSRAPDVIHHCFMVMVAIQLQGNSLFQSFKFMSERVCVCAVSTCVCYMQV